MPIYTYRCRKCDHTFERNQRMTDAPLSDCPTCDGSVRRVINSVGVVFKGSGFYVTDNRNGSGKANGGLNGVQKNGANGDAVKTGDAAKESKPATPAAARESASAPAAATA